MSYKSIFCPACNEYVGSYRPHTCLPQWEAWDIDEADADGLEKYASILKVYAADAEAAAAMCCAALDRDEAPRNRSVFVRPLGSREPAEQWDMDFSISVQYSGSVA